MSILSELMERKDLGVYVNLRLKQLNGNNGAVNFETIEPGKRSAAQQQVKGRIKEPRKPRKHLAQRDIKDESKRMWRGLQNE